MSRYSFERVLPAMDKLFVCFFTWVILRHTGNVNSADMNDTNSLYKKLMVTADYNRRIRPVMDQQKAVSVNITFNLASIQSFDELSGEMIIVGAITMTWLDERMLWDPQAYNDTYSIMIPQAEVWRPHLALTNPYDSIQVIGEDSFDIRFFSNGLASWTIGDVIKSTCSVDISLFPFDFQSCSLTYIPWGYDYYEVLLKTPVEKLDLDYFQPNGEWEYIDSSITSFKTTRISMARLELKIKRRSDFYIINILLPVIFLCFLNVCVFILPAESGEKVSYAITVLLALAVFLTLVSDNMPKTSLRMCLLSYFLMLTLIVSTLICLMTILLLRMHHENKNVPVPGWLSKIVMCLGCYKCRRNNSLRLEFDLKRNGDHIKNSEDSVPHDEPPADYTLAWKEVSKSLDIFFFVVFTILVLIMVMAFFIGLSRNSIDNQNALGP